MRKGTKMITYYPNNFQYFYYLLSIARNKSLNIKKNPDRVTGLDYMESGLLPYFRKMKATI